RAPAAEGRPRSHAPGRDAAPPTATRRASAPAAHPTVSPARARMARRFYGRAQPTVAFAPRKSHSRLGGDAMKRIPAIAALVLVPGLAHADTVFLKSGGEIKGDIVERRADTVVIEVGPGRITLPMRYVARIESNTTDVGVYR